MCKIIIKNHIKIIKKKFFHKINCFYYKYSYITELIQKLATRIVLDIFFDRINRIDFYPVTKYLINKTVQLLTGSLKIEILLLIFLYFINVYY